MPDPYRISDATQPAARPGTGPLRPLLWLGLIVSAAANAVTANIGINPLVGIGFGLATLACVTALIVHHYQHRRA